jgi:hypothetical protein
MFGTLDQICHRKNMAKKKPDPRAKIWAKQRKEWGFDDRETWALDWTIAEFVLPRLKRFKDVSFAFSAGSLAEWHKILDQMISAFDLTLADRSRDLTKQERRSMARGLKLFAKHFNDLWW